MAGLLDNIFATSTDDPRYAANMALFGNMVNGNFGKGLLDASTAGAQARTAQQEAAYRQLMAQNLQSEMAQREAKMRQAEQEAAFRRQFMGVGGPAAPGAQPAPMPGAAPGAMPQPQGAPQGQPQGGGFTAQQISQQYGVPIEAVIADFQFNDGKKIAELIEARSRPNWMNANGHVLNTNAPGFHGGYMPDPTKGVTMGPGGSVQLMPGATQAQSALTIATEGPKALLNSAGRVNLRTMPDNSQAPVSEFSENTELQRLLQQFTGQQGQPQPGAMPPQQQPPRQPTPMPSPVGQRISPESQRTADQESIRMMQAELLNPNLPPDQRAGVQREIARLQQAQAMPGFPAASSVRSPRMGPYGKTTEQTLAEEVARTKALDQTKADITPTAQRESAQASADYLLNTIGKALVHKGRETATGMSGTLDPRNYIPGTDATNFKVLLDQIKGSAFLEAYKSLKGGGAITEVEGVKAEKAIARLNTAQSDDEFKSALQDFQSVVKAGNDRMKGVNQPIALPPNPTAQSLTKGKTYALPGGKVGVWDGMGFKVQ